MKKMNSNHYRKSLDKLSQKSYNALMVSGKTLPRSHRGRMYEGSQTRKTVQRHGLSDMPQATKKPLARADHPTIRGGFMHGLCQRKKGVSVLVARQSARENRRCSYIGHPGIVATDIVAQFLLMEICKPKSRKKYSYCASDFVLDI